jgi:hypothetical protein
MQKRPSRTSEIRLAELVAALSIATDLGMGQPMEDVLRSCVLSVRLGETLGLSVSELREVYYLALLRYLGCNAGTHEQAALVGDELAMRTATLPVYAGQPSQTWMPCESPAQDANGSLITGLRSSHRSALLDLATSAAGVSCWTL